MTSDRTRHPRRPLTLLSTLLLVAAVALGLGACAPDDEPVEDAVATPEERAAAGQTDTDADDEMGMDETGEMAGSLALLDPNTAGRDELLAAPGVEAATIDALIAGRPYDDMTQVDAVLAESMEEAERLAVYEHLWKRIDLNTASGEEILLIPGVGDRMRHEFEEYRPYRGMEQFRREIGKYVDEDEVARLEQYVEIR